MHTTIPIKEEKRLCIRRNILQICFLLSKNRPPAFMSSQTRKKSWNKTATTGLMKRRTGHSVRAGNIMSQETTLLLPPSGSLHQPGGSTLGNISCNQVAVCTADVGIAQLAMHSICETCGANDTADLIRLAKVLFATVLVKDGDTYRL